MTNYKVFCANCMNGYECGWKPHICGMCGSDFIAVKPINVADALSLDDEAIPHDGPPYDAATATGMYDA